VVTCKIKSFAEILSAVDDRRKVISLQRLENVTKTFLEKWASPPAVVGLLLFTSVYML